MDTQLQNRSLQLASLSREHKEGMLFISKLRQGLNNKIPVGRLRDFTSWYWKNHIRPHFFQEEKILLPYMPLDHAWAIKLQEDHAYIRDLILTVDLEPDQQSFKILCDLLDMHIRFEEQEVFGWLEQNLTEEELNTIYKQLENHPVVADEWKDRF